MNKSFQKSILNYKQILKNQQTQQQKHFFLWKIFTLFLSLLFFASLYLLSQFASNLNSIKSYPTDTSFLFSLTQQSKTLMTTQHLLILLNSLRQPTFYPNSNSLYSSSTIHTAQIIRKVLTNKDILFLFRTSTTFFGIYVPQQQQYASVMNMKTGDQTSFPKCKALSVINQSIILISSIVLNPNKDNNLYVNISDSTCFNDTNGEMQFSRVTGLSAKTGEQSIQFMQIFSLY